LLALNVPAAPTRSLVVTRTSALLLFSCDELLLVTTRLSFDCFFEEENDADVEADVFAEEELNEVSAPVLNEVSVLNGGLESAMERLYNHPWQ
jgi:hypothetical protein